MKKGIRDKSPLSPEGGDRMRWKEVQVGKIDLDTCGAAWLLAGSEILTFGEKLVKVLPGGQATEEDLANPEILCIEVGGSGRISERNFDHHGREDLPSATYQAWVAELREVLELEFGKFFVLQLAKKASLVDYIDRLDRYGPRAFPKREEIFPTLSDLFAGMLLITKDPVEQLKGGIELLRQITLPMEGNFQTEIIDPFGRVPIEGNTIWRRYAEAKANNDRCVAEATKQALWGKTSSGLTLAWLETDFIGAPGALYGVGAQVVVVYSPHFGPAKVPKFTIAGNGVKVDAALPVLNAREPGWGGPASGTIIGSPREGSSLTLEEVVRIVQEVL